MTTLFAPAEVRNAVELLASRSLIRLVTEIDDNGAIPARRLAATLPDLSTHELRRAFETARTHALVRTAPGAALELTNAGAELADLYDAAARWSRRHASPAPVCAFSTRVRHVLDLLTPSLAADSAEAEADLARPRALLLQWLTGNPQVTALSDPEPVA
ncbi:regulator [Streptomyces sp. NPDC058683]|uniref:regulator n=1 Tax=Streptomyces sp. NPDC058683 TaxID=3346597 RepID=UPI0036605A7B